MNKLLFWHLSICRRCRKCVSLRYLTVRGVTRRVTRYLKKHGRHIGIFQVHRCVSRIRAWTYINNSEDKFLIYSLVYNFEQFFQHVNEISYIWTAEKDMNLWLIIAVIYTTWAVVKLKPEKNSGLNGIRTHDLCDTGAVLYRLSYQAIWELVTLWVYNIPVKS